MFCIIDNYDSFTFNLVHLIEKEGERVTVYRNDHDPDEIDSSRFRGMVISPGPSTPEHSGITLDLIARSRIPILGVCLGMQSIAHVFGGAVVHAARIMHGKVDTVTHDKGLIFRGVPSPFSAVRYHSLAVSREELPACFEVCAHSGDGEIMAIAHRERFIWGLQFHPESYLTEHGTTILRNFIGGCYEY